MDIHPRKQRAGILAFSRQRHRDSSMNTNFKSSLHHIGIIVPDRRHVDFLNGILGLETGEPVYVPEYEADCIFTSKNSSNIEFVIPRENSKLSNFNKGMGGLHHIALEVDDILDVSGQLAEEGIDLLEDKPVQAGQLLINFLHPAETRGFIVEFVQVIVEDR
jgi:methylmalonyl-CoA epimerase